MVVYNRATEVSLGIDQPMYRYYEPLKESTVVTTYPS